MRRRVNEPQLHLSVGERVCTDGDVLVGGLSAVQVVLGEELQQLRLDTAERLVLPVEQHHQV